MKTLTNLLLAGTAVALLSGGAMAADLYVAPAAAPMAPAVSAWDGAYIGASLGYSWGTFVDSIADGTGTPTGGFIGGEVGYNFHLTDGIVVGIQGDLSWNNETTGVFTGTSTTDTESARINWDGAVMGRLGFDAGAFLPYVEGGIGFANATLTDITTFPPNENYTATHTGWVVGAGVQFALADRLSANIEYRYANYGTAIYESGSPAIALTDSSIRVGLDFHL